MPTVFLVRHAETRRDPAVASVDWELTPAGRAVASSLAGMPRKVFSSPEPKALQTARLITADPVETLDEFREHVDDRVGYLTDAEFAGAVERYFAERLKRVWGHSHAETAERFRAGLERAAARAGDQPFAVVTHGRILCSYIGSVSGSSGYELWKMLTMPTVIRIAHDGKGARVETISFLHRDADLRPDVGA